MQLRITRSQKQGGMIGKHVVFCIDARAELTQEEADDVKKYGLGKEVIYNSQRAREHFEKSRMNAESGSGMGMVKAFASLAMAKLSLNITINSLVQGEHIEVKDMDEAMGAIEALEFACARMKGYLETAATFDGVEKIIEY